jgi:hypothetical protein
MNINEILVRSEGCINTCRAYGLAVTDWTGCPMYYGPFASPEEAAAYADMKLPANQRDMHQTVFEFLSVQRPEVGRTRAELTASGWDDHPEGFMPGTLVRYSKQDDLDDLSPQELNKSRWP